MRSRGRVMPRVVATCGVAVVLLGCGARTDVGDLDGGTAPVDAFVARDATVRRDAGPPRREDAGPPDVRSCAVSCGWCRPAGPPVEIAEHGQGPDVTWDGEKLLVVYDDAPGITVTAFDLEGDRRWTEGIMGLQWARVAFDPEGGAGMVVFDSGVHWLGPDGRPVGGPVGLSFMGWQLQGDISATSSGFLLMTGAGAYSEPPGLFFDRFGRAPGGLVLAPLAPEGPRAPPEHAEDEAGRATLVASTTWDGTAGEVYIAGAGGEPEPMFDIGSEHGAVAGVARGREDDVLVLRSQTGWSLWLERWFDDETMTSTLLGTSSRGASGHMLPLEGPLAVASPVLDDADRVAVACVDPRLPDPVSPATVLATRSISHSPRMTRTPRGYAVVWTETADPSTGLVPMLQVMECCVEE